MKQLTVKVLLMAMLAAMFAAGCRQSTAPVLQPAKFGVKITEVSGSKQLAQVGSALPQPVVVQVNGADGNAVVGALVTFKAEGVQFTPAQALTDSSGQVTANVQLGFSAGDYQIVAETPKSGGGSDSLTLRETALGYEQTLGAAVNDKYCIRCHNNESTPERVSNFDNLSPAAHLFTDGAALNRMSDADLTSITQHGGAALGKSPQMPAYSSTLTPAEMKAVVAYIRAVADPPYQPPGVKYAK
jgi:cbb3-type cytochrome c oxidase subunit III